MDWQAMVLLGAYHGINPGMGWLFAAALGMQQGSVRGVWRALPPIVAGHALSVGVVLVTDIDLSVDDRYLYVSCWGTGEFIQYDVTDPFNPKKVSSIRLGGIAGRAAHPSHPRKPLNGGPQMIEVSRDGKRVYVTNSLYTPWDSQFYPDGIRGWMAKVNVDPRGGMALDGDFFLDTGDMRPHQVRLEGGDASSDSYCYA